MRLLLKVKLMCIFDVTSFYFKEKKHLVISNWKMVVKASSSNIEEFNVNQRESFEILNIRASD